MQLPSGSRVLDSLSAGLSVPPLARTGAGVIAGGLIADLVEHTLVPHVHDAVVAGFPVSEHLAHFVVLVGMVLVLVAIVADGASGRRRQSRPEGSPRDAVR